MPRTRTSVPDEIAALERLVATVAEAEGSLAAALKDMGRLIDTTDEPALMPNYHRAAEQVRVAVNAAAGARRSLERRLALQRAARRARE
jgi:hypothetical protein